MSPIAIEHFQQPKKHLLLQATYPWDKELHFATWNIEGLTDVKIAQLQNIMLLNDIHILCIQETHQPGAFSYVSDSGFLIINSGGLFDAPDHAGVGFIVSPRSRSFVIGFRKHSNRIASIDLRIQGGKAVLFSAYAPHGGYSYEDRQTYFSDLSAAYSRVSSHGPKIIMGDLNDRLAYTQSGEADIIGEFTFGSEHNANDPLSNRNLLVQLCFEHELRISNSFCNQPVEQRVSFFAIGATPFSDLVPANFATLDHVLCPQSWHNTCGEISTHRNIAFASHHFLMIASMDLRVERTQKQTRIRRYDLKALKNDDTSTSFKNKFCNNLQTMNTDLHRDMNRF